MRNHCRGAQVKRMITSIDKTGSGKIDFNEFLELLLAKMVLASTRSLPWPLALPPRTVCSSPLAAWPRPQSERDTKEDAMRAFKQFDVEHQGKISFENLKQISSELGAPLDPTHHARAGWL